MRAWEIDEIKRAIWSCRNKKKSHYENSGCKISNAIRNEETKLKALNRRLPRKVRINDDELYCCPNCDSTFKLFDSCNQRNKCCGNCGQALDWGEADA